MGLKEARKTFSDYIRKKELRNTTQRQRILEAFLSSERHITAEDLYKNIQKKYPEIGFATVYRNLKLMCESGIAEEIKIGNQKSKYEHIDLKQHHDHLICIKCGRFYEVFDERIENLQVKLAEKNDFLPVRHRLEIYGLCRNCR